MIQLDRITKHYGSYLAVDNLSFHIGEGEIVAFIGPNGAGKTTTMRILTGYLPPDMGEVRVNGVDMYDEPERVKAEIGYLPENPPLYPELTVSEYLIFVARLKKVPKNLISKRVEEALEMTDLKERRNTMIRYLSKGLKQRTGIAQAIINHPKVLILDEPTVGLDPKQVMDIRSLVQNLAKDQKRTVLLSTHILAEAAAICEKAIIINDGKIVAMDSIKELSKMTAGDIRLRVSVARKADEAFRKLEKLKGIKTVSMVEGQIHLVSEYDNREEVAKTLANSTFGLLEMFRVRDSLEDTFIKLIQTK